MNCGQRWLGRLERPGRARTAAAARLGGLPTEDKDRAGDVALVDGRVLAADGRAVARRRGRAKLRHVERGGNTVDCQPLAVRGGREHALQRVLPIAQADAVIVWQKMTAMTARLVCTSLRDGSQ